MVFYGSRFQKFILSNSLIQKTTLLFLLALCQIIIIGITGIWGDVNNYWIDINSIIEKHQFPYSDFDFEYPPLTLIIFLIPRLFQWNLNSYHYSFAIFMAIFFIIGFYFATRIAARFNAPEHIIFIIFFATLVFMFPFVITRYDVVPSTLIILQISLYLDKKYSLAFFVLQLGTMTKLYPALLFIPFILPLISQKKYVDFFKQTLFFVQIIALIQLPFLINSPSTAFSYLSYHQDRGIQVESIIGSFIEIYNYFVPQTCSIVINYGSDNLIGQIPDFFASIYNIMMVVSMLLFVILVLIIALRTDSEDNEKIKKLFCLSQIAIVLIFIVFNKVYSAQYGIWILMLSPLGLVIFPDIKNDKFWHIFFILGILSLIASLYYSSMGTFNLQTLLPLAEFIKNLATIALLVILLKKILSLANWKISLDSFKLR